MKIARIIRGDESDHGTFGVILAPGFWCYTAELPWRDNRKERSCIPKGEYICKLRKSPRYGLTFHVTDVNNRTYILIHPGNWAGDVDKGYRSNSNGCILLGKKMGRDAKGQRTVWTSKPAVRKFMNAMGEDPFLLIVEGV